MFAQVLRALRVKRNMKQSELAEALGIERSTISKWESGVSVPPIKMMKKLSELFGVSMNQFVEGDLDEESSEEALYVEIPVLGTVQAGPPSDAVENIIGTEQIPRELAEHGEYFALMIRGDSMSPRMLPGDIVIVRRQQDVKSGEIAVVMVGNENATVKKISKHTDGVSLIALNPSYTPLFYTNREIMNLPVTIIGRVVELRGKY